MLAACASDGIEVATTFDPLTRLPARADYHWDEAASRWPADARVPDAELGAMIREVADEAFAARGYSAVPGDSPYALSYSVDVHTWIGGPDGAGSVATTTFQLVEEASGRRVWTGVVRLDVWLGLEPAERRDRLRRAMERLLEKFPPRQRGD